jgi:predicted permease
MSIFQRAFFAGIARIFSLPRLSIPLILTLGLTLGAVLSVIAISTTLLYKPLEGIRDEDKILTFEYRLNVSDTLSVSYWDMRRLADFNQSFKSLGTWAGIGSTEQDIVIDGVTYPTTQHTASDTILDVLGTRLLTGQDVKIASPEDFIWISNSLWQQAFSGLDSAIGKQIVINSKNYVIAGVLEDLMAVESTTPILRQQIWLITNLTSQFGQPEVPSINGLIDALLLKTQDPSTTVPTEAQAQQWVEEFITTNVDEFQAAGYLSFIKNTPIDVIGSNYRSKLLGDTKDLLVALFIAVVGLLLMATLNLLNLFIAHYQGRTKEFSIQLTLGASLLKVKLLVLLENLPSFIIAAITGLLVTGWVIKILPIIAGNNLPLVGTIGIDTTTIISSFAIILILSVVFSALALVDINKQALATNLNSSGKGLQAQSNQWISRSLMIVQLSIASILLTASVMLAIQSYDAVYRELGYDAGNSYTVTLFNSDEEWATALADIREYQGSEFQQLQLAVDDIIESQVAGAKVIINSNGPLSDNFQGNVFFPEGSPDQRLVYQMRFLSADYFSAFSIPMIAGSNLTEQQVNSKERRIVIDENMAEAVFPGEELGSVIGQSIKLLRDSQDGEFSPPFIVTGIVPATQSQAGAVETNQMPAVYSANINATRTLSILVLMPEGTQLTAAMLEPELRKAFPRLINLRVQSSQDLWQEQTLSQRVSLWVVLTMTGLTLLLAAIGVSGLTQMTTNHRKYELAVRMATGAKQINLIGFIVKDAVGMLVIGLGLGFVLSAAGYEKIMETFTMLPDFNWIAMSTLDMSLVLIVLLSVFIPAWRVINADPMQALRQE